MSSSELLKQVQKAWEKHVCHPDLGNVPAGSQLFFERNDIIRYQEHPYIQKMVEKLDVKNKNVLEVGVGVGADAALLTQKGARFFGLDLTKNAVTLTQKRFHLFQLNGIFLISNAEVLPFKSESFDMVYSMGVLHHTPGEGEAICEIYRILKKEGQAIIMLYYKNLCTYYLKLLLGRGILKGLFLKKSKAEIINELEYSGCPLTKLYSKKGAKELFKNFSNINMQAKYLSRHSVPWIGKFIPQRFFDRLAPYFGFHLVIFASKGKSFSAVQNL